MLSRGRSGRVSKPIGWWGKILKAVGEGDESWFFSGLVKEIGDKSNSFFWEDYWDGHYALKIDCGRLYILCLDKSVKVSDIGGIEGERVGLVWKWRRELFQREKPMLNLLIELLNKYP